LAGAGRLLLELGYLDLEFPVIGGQLVHQIGLLVSLGTVGGNVADLMAVETFER